MSRKLTHTEFLEKLPECIKNNFDFINKYTSSNNFVYLRDKLGIIYKQKPHWLITGRYPGIKTAVNKTDALQKIINDIFDRRLILKSQYTQHEKELIVEDRNGIKYKTTAANLKDGKFPTFRSSIDKKKTFIFYAQKIHGKNYDYSKINPIFARDKVAIICPIHGEFYQSYNTHITMRQGCNKCSNDRVAKNRRLTNEEFINKAKEVHGDKYDYSLVNYATINSNVDIICKIHGKFSQLSGNHLSGSNCPKCVKESHVTTGFSKTDWLRKFNTTKIKGNPIIYIIECYSEYEKFIKIGKTFRSVTARFGKCPGDKLPYNYKLIKVIEGSAEEIYTLEKQLHSKYKTFKYKPLKQFKGQTECFDMRIIKDFISYEK